MIYHEKAVKDAAEVCLCFSFTCSSFYFFTSKEFRFQVYEEVLAMTKGRVEDDRMEGGTVVILEYLHP